MSKRMLIALTVVAALLLIIAAQCGAATPQTIIQTVVVEKEKEVIVTKEVEKEVVVTKEVKAEKAKALPLRVFGAYAANLDEPWDSVVHAALNKAKEEGKITYDFSENIGYSGDMERVLREVAESGKYDMIAGDAFGNEEGVRRAAADYPDVAFVFGSGLGPVSPNFSVFDNWIHEAGYLAGMLAGGMTKSNVIGVVGGFPVPEVNRVVNAFIGGAKEVNPKVKVRVTFINSWFDPAAAKEQALAHIDAGADVLFAERFGVIEAAAQKKLWAIGMMKDQNEIAPDYVLTSVSWNMDGAINYVINQVAAGSYTAQDLKDFTMMARGGAFLAPYHNTESKIPQELKDKVDKKKDDILKGLFRIDINEGQPAAEN
jgi:basic membrane protein A and related proteins